MCYPESVPKGSNHFFSQDPTSSSEAKHLSHLALGLETVAICPPEWQEIYKLIKHCVIETNIKILSGLKKN